MINESLPPSWKLIGIGETDIEIIDGDRGKNYPKSNELLESGYCPFFNNKNLIGDKINLNEVNYITKDKDEKLRKGKAFIDDIILTTRGSVGNVGFMHKGLGIEFARINSGMVIFRNKSKMFETQFLYYLLKSPYVKSQYKQLSTGSAQPQLPIRDIKNILLIAPPKDQQKLIVSIIESIENKININSKINQTLEEMAFIIYKKITVENSIRTTKRLKDFLVLNPTISVKKGTFLKYVDMKALPTNHMSVSNEDIIEREYKSGTKFMNNDVLLARITPCLENGKLAFVNFLNDGEIAYGSTEFIVLRANEKSCPQFLYCLVKDQKFKEFAKKSMVGTSGRQRIQNNILLEYKMPDIDMVQMNKFDKLTKDWFSKIRANTIENTALRKIHEYLIPRLLSGDIDLSEVEETLENIMQ